ncbi:MAG: TfuA-like protein, partial [Nitrososphaerales archaeon]
MLPIIFLGPSLSLQKAKEIFPLADYRPPARKGDFLKITNDRNNTGFVGFIDGVFLQDYPPTPIEVYSLLQKNNITVAGAASLGALRAVELEKFGMIGIGKIFRLYRSGRLESDDEVAVTFSDHDYKLQSEALIDIRYTLYYTLKDGIIDHDTKNILVKIAKRTYFPSRNYDEILERARIDGVEYKHLERLKEYLTTHRRSLKEEDSIKLIQFIKERYLES